MEELVLSIDCGTQSLRAILFSLDGKIVGKEKVEYNPYFSIKPGWAEQDPEIYWDSLCKACQKLKERDKTNFSKIKGLGVTTLRDSMVNIGKDGNPLRPIITWLDQRKAKSYYKPGFPINMALKMVGMDSVLQKMEKDGKSNWVRQNQPEIWENTHKYVQVSGFLNHRFTGEFVDSVASQIGHIPFDYKKLEWGNPFNPLAFSSKLYPVEKEKLAGLVAPGKEIGRVTQIASRQTGIPEGVKVIACGSDKGCETLGMGVIDNTMASLSFGTTATIQTTTPFYIEPLPFLPSYPAVIPNKFNPEIEIFRGYWMITWFKNEFAYKEVQMATLKGIPPEVVMNDLLNQAPPGAMGLVVQPYWSPGLGEPLAKGSIIGFGDVHKKAHVYRAVIEGLAFALLDGKYKLEKKGKTNFSKMAVSGGASQSSEICQINADIFNLPMVQGSTFETSGLGAAICTAFGVGAFSSLEEAVKNMVTYQKTFNPNPKNVEIYSQLFHKVYKKMYKSLAPLYKEIQKITGYPE